MGAPSAGGEVQGPPIQGMQVTCELACSPAAGCRGLSAAKSTNPQMKHYVHQALPRIQWVICETLLLLAHAGEAHMGGEVCAVRRRPGRRCALRARPVSTAAHDSALAGSSSALQARLSIKCRTCSDFAKPAAEKAGSQTCPWLHNPQGAGGAGAGRERGQQRHVPGRPLAPDFCLGVCGARLTRLGVAHAAARRRAAGVRNPNVVILCSLNHRHPFLLLQYTQVFMLHVAHAILHSDIAE